MDTEAFQEEIQVFIDTVDAENIALEDKFSGKVDKDSIQMTSIGTGIGSSSVMQSQTFLTVEKTK